MLLQQKRVKCQCHEVSGQILTTFREVKIDFQIQQLSFMSHCKLAAQPAPRWEGESCITRSLSSWLRGRGPRKWLGSDLLPCSPKFQTLTKKFCSCCCRKRGKSKMTATAGRAALCQPLLTMASSSSMAAATAQLSSPCPLRLVNAADK